MCHDLFTRNKKHQPNTCEKHPAWGALQLSQWKFYLDVDSFPHSLAPPSGVQPSPANHLDVFMMPDLLSVSRLCFFVVGCFFFAACKLWEFSCSASCLLRNLSQTSVIVLVPLDIFLLGFPHVATNEFSWLFQAFVITGSIFKKIYFKKL